MKQIKGEGIFGSWLAEQMTTADMNVNEMSYQLGTNKSIVSMHLHNQRAPTIRHLQRYSEIFNVSFDYIFSLACQQFSSIQEGAPHIYQNHNYVEQNSFSYWLRERLIESGMTGKDLAKAIGIDPPLFSLHLNQRRRPSYKSMALYADYFKVDMWELYNMMT